MTDVRKPVVVEDTRNKPDKNKHIKDQLEALGYKVVRSKLYVGDYTYTTNQSICIDTKFGLEELCQNVIQGHERFRNECIRANEAGIQLIILVADDHITNLADVFSWKNPRRFYSKRATTGKTLGKILYKMRDSYGVKFEFAHKDKIGERIVELLGGDCQ